MFFSYFESIYQSRWPQLLAALKAQPVRHPFPLFGGFSTYHIDEASVFVGRQLDLQAGDRVLDLCAAPGGKTLIMLHDFWQRFPDATQEMFPHVTANELSLPRRMRLLDVLKNHLPALYLAQIRVTDFNGEQVGMKQAAQYDKILVDVPCSSERHLLEKKPDQPDWTRARTQSLAKRQYSLLCSALLALKSGGELVYSTCSISPYENDDVIDRILNRKSDQAQLIEIEPKFPGAEATKFGVQIFPDRANAAGPMYVSKLRRL